MNTKHATVDQTSHPILFAVVSVWAFGLLNGFWNQSLFHHSPTLYWVADTGGRALLPLLYLQRRFPGANPTPAYVVVSASLFGLAHWENGLHEIIATSTLGVIACGIYLKLRTLWPFIAAHFMIDIVAYI